MAVTNHAWTLAARPAGFPKESDFKLKKTMIPNTPADKVLVRTQYLSVDPYMRGRMNEARAYADPVEIGGVMVGGGVGTVVESNDPKFKPGDEVSGNWGWQEYGLVSGDALQKIDTSLAPISYYLGILGMPGMTAYFGFLDLCKPKPGETVFVSGAAGAVGSLVGQIAKIKGCHVAGSAGTDAKVQYMLDECGFDAAFNYKEVKDYTSKLRELFPKGIDCYFDNVGGAMTDAVLINLAQFARISICGVISQYNLEKPQRGPRLWSMLLIRQAKAQGFLVPQFMARYAEGATRMSAWLKEGKLAYREDVADGFQTMPGAFIRMLKGGNEGKQVIKVWQP